MNNRFTLKAGIICFSLLICQLALKAQTNPAPKSDTSFAVKADTALSIKAGSTMVIKSDTTLVINADTAAMRRVAAALAKKADDMRNSDKSNLAPMKTADTSMAKSNTPAIVTPVVTTPAAPTPTVITPPVITPPVAATTMAVATTTTIAPPTDGTTEVKNITPSTNGAGQNKTTTIAQPTDGMIEVKNANGTMQTKDTNPAATSPVKPDSTAALVKKTDSTATNTMAATTPAPAANNTTDATTPAKDTNSTTDAATPAKDKDVNVAASTSAITVPSTSVSGSDTTVAKKDTLLAKKDTSLAKRSDTTIVQKDSTKSDSTIKAQNVYLEVGGAGLAISANYDARFKKERNGWGYRVGVGFFTAGGNTVETIPFQINYLIGEHAHMLELGAGTTFLNSVGTNVGTSKFEFDKVTGFIGTATIGYRFQPEHKGINVRIAFVPILYDEGLIPAGGISIGYTFK